MPKHDPNARTALYRLLAANGRLLYVGIAANPDSRWGQHSTNQKWWVDVADRKIEWFPNRAAAAAAEVAAIKAERPLHNIQHAARGDQLPFGKARMDWDVRGALALLQERVGTVQDLGAEQAVLTDMLKSRGAIADAIALIRPADYYRPAHGLIHRTIAALYAEGETVDSNTVSSELLKRGEITRIGGPSYLDTLANSASAPGGAEYYAQIVRERAIMRRLIEASVQIARTGYAGEGDADEIVAAAQGAIAAAVR